MGDLVNSRGLRDRALYKGLLDCVIRRVNREHAGVLVARLKVVRGVDELGCAVATTGGAVAVVRAISAGVLPERYRFGLARGAVDVRPNCGDVTQMDGPAFHRASDALDRARALRTLIEVHDSVRVTAELRRILDLQGEAE